MLLDYAWNYFYKTGSVEAYLLYNELKELNCSKNQELSG